MDLTKLERAFPSCSSYLVRFNVRELEESIKSKVGEGAFGKVYKADLPVAVKAIQHGSDPRERPKFAKLDLSLF